MLPFFSSKKNFFIIGSMPADVPERMDVLEVGATASSCLLYTSIGDTLAADITADGTGRLIVTLTESPVSTGYLAAGAVFTFWPRVTEYSEYDEVLANICDLRLAGTHLSLIHIYPITPASMAGGFPY